MAVSLQVTGTLRLRQRAPCKTVGSTYVWFEPNTCHHQSIPSLTSGYAVSGSLCGLPVVTGHSRPVTGVRATTAKRSQPAVSSWSASSIRAFQSCSCPSMHPA